MSGQAQVMVVDDDVAMRNFLRCFLAERGYDAVVFATADEAVKRFSAERPAAVILDVVIPGGMDGLDALAAFKKIDREVPVIVLSGQGRTPTVVQAMKLGASDFVNKPFVDSELDGPLLHALKQRQISREVASLREQLQSQGRYEMLFGTGERMVEVRNLIHRVADTDVPVLIRGESGTGKELVARALFASSLRREKPFVKVNCAALPTDLLESELFGFERGAFTGAIHQKPGRFEFANHGTMFLDEIGEMAPPLQAKLLQVVQDGEFSRLGGKHDVHVDVRIIAATNRPVEQAVADGLFREDLFFRLNVVSITVPPLRERRDEIPTLVESFIARYARKYKRTPPRLSPRLRELFQTYDWPGNIRELENTIKRLVILQDEQIALSELERNMRRPTSAASAVVETPAAPAPVAVAPPAAEQLENEGAGPDSGPDGEGNEGEPVVADEASSSLAAVARAAAMKAERALIEKTLTQVHWNRRKASQILGVSYKTLLNKIKECGISRG
jgi:two-component system response regulator AtoC